MNRLIDLLPEVFAVVGRMVTSFLLVLGALFLYYTKLYRLFDSEGSRIGTVAGGIAPSMLFGAVSARFDRAAAGGAAEAGAENDPLESTL